MLKKTVAVLIGLSVLVGCGSAPKKPALSPEEIKTQQSRLDSIKKVEIFYSNDNHIVVFDGGGSGLTGLSGGFGVVGLFAGLAIDAGSKLNSTERAAARGKEFTAKVKAENPSFNLSKDFAEKLAQRIRDTGREVKLTPLTSQRASEDLAEYKELSAVTPGHSAILLWNNPGFAAEDATSSYAASAAIEYYCKDQNGNKISNWKFRKLGSAGYMTYSGLLADSRVAVEKLRETYLSLDENIFKSCFTVAESQN